jgi:citrate lyase subunit beta/citryl-CoA lyase
MLKLVLEAYDCLSEAGGTRGAAMLRDEMIDEASRRIALAVVARGKAAGLGRTFVFELPHPRAGNWPDETLPAE